MAEVFVVLTHDNRFCGVYATEAAALNEAAYSSAGVDRVELTDGPVFECVKCARRVTVADLGAAHVTECRHHDGCPTPFRVVRELPAGESAEPGEVREVEAAGHRLYDLLAVFDTRDGSPLAHLVRSAREGWERSGPEMREEGAWDEFDARLASYEPDAADPGEGARS